NFGEYNMWLAAENGMFLRSTRGEWMTTMPEHLNMDWVDSVKHVFEYFTERTPRSHFEHRETSLVWNYKYADIEFGRLQARDMLQHLWTGPISNSSVDVVHGSRSVEVRSVGVTKGAAIDRILGEIVHSKAIGTPIDYVLCIGHFLGKDEDVYTFFEPELPPEPLGLPRSKVGDAIKLSPPTCMMMNNNNNNISSSSDHNGNNNKKSSSSSSSSSSSNRRSQQPQSSSSMSTTTWNVLDLKKENYFSCAVGRPRTNARYLLNTSDDVVAFLKELGDACS
ncbi:trehalose-6-phosphate synthase, partial [Genlisea aurea]